MLGRTELIPVEDGERRRIGPVDCQFIPVTHSVPHGFAIAFFTPVGTIVHSGDFKLDLTPVDGRRTNLAMLGDIASRDGGIRLLMSDSTNAERPGFTPSESTVGAAMRSLFREYPDKRFIVTSFASHLHRVQQVAQAAIANGRKIAFVGRSMQQNITMARERGFIDIPDWAVIDIEETPKLAPGRSVHRLHRLAGRADERVVADGAHEHKHVKISPDDVVVISAHAIPGNESNVSRVIDSLHRAGAEVVHDRTSPVHVSGHASQEELKFMLNLLEPEWFVPVHGEYRHLVHHAAGARGRYRRGSGHHLRRRRRHHAHDRRRLRRTARGSRRLHVRRRNRRRHRPRRAARSARPLRRGRGRRDPDRRHPGRQGS